MTVVVRSGLAIGERRIIDYPERREVTRRFSAPVFDHTEDEYSVRYTLACLYSWRSQLAAARSREMTNREIVPMPPVTSKQALLDRFDAQNRAVLGLEGL